MRCGRFDMPIAPNDLNRILPVITPLTEPFWKGGMDGLLHIQRCRSCNRFLHPPRYLCTHCLSREVQWQAVSGFGTVESFTINYQPWRPAATEPYVIAVIRLSEQPDLHLTTNIIGCQPDSVYIGQEVRVSFLEVEDVFLPVFEPVT
jgi:uncharacterized OB-fold protein